MKEDKSAQKAEILKEKIYKLADKIKSEQNPTKRMLYSIKAKMVIAKLEREIEIAKIRDLYSKDREEAALEFLGEKVENRTTIIDLTKRIGRLREYIAQNEDYDVASPNFLFGSGEVNEQASIEDYIETLKSTGVKEQIETANMIKDVELAKKNLEAMEKERAEIREQLNGIGREQKLYNMKSKTTETAMIVKEKMNIFKRISQFFKIAKESFGERREEKKEEKQYNYSKKEARDSKKEAIKKAKRRCARRVARAKKEYAQAKSESHRNKLDKQAENRSNMASKQAEEFLARIHVEPSPKIKDSKMETTDRENEQEQSKEPEIE